MPTTAETVEQYLTALGWSYQPAEGLPGVWLTHVESEACALDLQVRLNPHWLMVAGLYLRADQVPPARRAALAEHLLQLNHRYPLVKFGLDDDGDVRLSTELPANDVSQSQFQAALQMIALVGLECHPACLQVISEEGPS